MFETFRVHKADWLVFGAYGVFGILGLNDHGVDILHIKFAVIALVSCAAWVYNYRLLTQLEDTPASTIASTAQGYAEISGQAEEPGGTPIRSVLSDSACIWYHYEIHEGNNKVESGESSDPFVVRDASGQCIVDPEGAQVLTSRREVWSNEGRVYIECTLLPHDRIFALGEFTTLRDSIEENIDTDIGELLAEWKKNRPALLKRFDLNQDGNIDAREWELARHQARREVEARPPGIRAVDGTSMLHKPADGRPFLISNYLPEKIERGYLIWAWLHALIFFGAASGAIFSFWKIGFR